MMSEDLRICEMEFKGRANKLVKSWGVKWSKWVGISGCNFGSEGYILVWNEHWKRGKVERLSGLWSCRLCQLQRTFYHLKYVVVSKWLTNLEMNCKLWHGFAMACPLVGGHTDLQAGHREVNHKMESDGKTLISADWSSISRVIHWSSYFMWLDSHKYGISFWRSHFLKWKVDNFLLVNMFWFQFQISNF